jgi:hypothetical protein
VARFTQQAAEIQNIKGTLSSLETRLELTLGAISDLSSDTKSEHATRVLSQGMHDRLSLLESQTGGFRKEMVEGFKSLSESQQDTISRVSENGPLMLAMTALGDRVDTLEVMAEEHMADDMEPDIVPPQPTDPSPAPTPGVPTCQASTNGSCCAFCERLAASVDRVSAESQRAMAVVNDVQIGLAEAQHMLSQDTPRNVWVTALQARLVRVEALLPSFAHHGPMAEAFASRDGALRAEVTLLKREIERVRLWAEQSAFPVDQKQPPPQQPIPPAPRVFSTEGDIPIFSSDTQNNTPHTPNTGTSSRTPFNPLFDDLPPNGVPPQGGHHTGPEYVPPNPRTYTPPSPSLSQYTTAGTDHYDFHVSSVRAVKANHTHNPLFDIWSWVG